MNALLIKTLMRTAPLWLAGAAFAGPGHDHSHDDAAPAMSAPASPRFAAASEQFELVGVLEGQHIHLYLDRFADNSPVAGARIELDVGGATYRAEPQGEGEYEVTLKDALKDGVIPITATVTAGEASDLLAGELDLHGDEDSADASSGVLALFQRPTGRWLLAGVLALALVAALATVRIRRRQTHRQEGLA